VSLGTVAAPLAELNDWWNKWRARPRRREATGILGKVCERLGGFSASTEAVFLPVGAQLMELQTRAREIAAQTASISQLLTQDEGSLGMLGDVLNAAGESQSEAGIVATVEGIEASAKAIRQTIGVVVRLVNTFDVLGMMTRIESSRFESDGSTFAGLADAVTGLSRQIRERIAVTADSATVLLQSTLGAVSQVRQVAQTRRENLGPLTRQTGAGLVQMKDQRTRVSQANEQLAARFGGVSRALGDLVTALQSHDIVRQQIEHVLDALRQADGAANLFGIARLQAAQLNHARATFENSVGRVGDALGQIERNIDDVAEESARLLGDSEADKTSCFSAVEAGLSSVLAILDSNAAADKRLADVAVSFHGSVSDISQTVAGVHAIGIEMQRIALNAAIQAARLGPRGGALEIAAGAIQNLAREVEGASDDIEKRLNQIRDGAVALDEATSALTGADGRIGELRKSASALRGVQESARGGYAETMESIAGLKRQVRETIAGFGRQNEPLENLSQASEMLRGVSNLAPAGSAEIAAPLAAQYTMQSERAVHEALHEGVPLPDALEDSAAAPSADCDVEFF
jgi:chromosome segregation ATPase